MSTDMKIAVITQVFNEDLFLPIWLNYYGKIFGYNNLIVIDDGSSDGSTNDVRIKKLVKKRRMPLDETDRAHLISLFHEELLKYFDIVIYTDCDELIAVDPLTNVGLRQYLGSTKSKWLNVIGFHILHDKTKEARLDLELSLFSQRSFLRFDPLYCKPLLSKVPIRWSPGFHESDKERVFDENLFMFHLRSVDYEYSRRRIKILNSVEFSAESLSRNDSYQFRMTEEQFLEAFYTKFNLGIDRAVNIELRNVFHNHLRFQSESGATVRIPDRFVDVIELSSRILDCDESAKALNFDYRNSAKKLSKNKVQAIFDDCLERLTARKRRSRNSS